MAMFAAQRDKSDTKTPDANPKWHVVIEGKAACRPGMKLVLQAVPVPAAKVPLVRRCMLMPCRMRWPR